MNHKQFYQFAYNYLLEKEGVTEELLKRHFSPEFNKPDDLNSVYKRLCSTAQNKQMSPKIIGESIGGIDNLDKVLFNFNPKEVSLKYNKSDSELLLENIIEVLKPKGQVRKTPKSIWPLFCNSVIDSAHFLNQFDSAQSFYEWADFFAKDEKAKPALPLLISIEIRGIGFPLACDFLKEIGYLNFGKPDVHLKEIFKELNLIDSKNSLQQDYQTLKLIDEIAKENKTDAFEIDRVFWLIGSGEFYLSDLKIGRNRNDFISKTKKYFNI